MNLNNAYTLATAFILKRMLDIWKLRTQTCINRINQSLDLVVDVSVTVEVVVTEMEVEVTDVLESVVDVVVKLVPAN